MAELTDRFGTMVFSEEVMKDYLPKDIWKRLAATLEGGEPLDLDVANAVAHAMKVSLVILIMSFEIMAVMPLAKNMPARVTIKGWISI